MKTKLTLIVVFFFAAFFFVKSASAQCFSNHHSCDTSEVCCGFPSWQCYQGYCVDNQPNCGTNPYQCCSAPNPSCVSGQICSRGYCVTPTSTPTCGIHGGNCCTTAPACIDPSDRCVGNICETWTGNNPTPVTLCGRHLDPCCPPPAQPCSSPSDYCDATSHCNSVPPPAGSSPGSTGIDFQMIGSAIPGLKSIFQPGPASNVSAIISLVVPYLFIIAGLLLLFYLILGGFHMIIASGDEKGLLEAKGKITNALIGFVILFVAYWLVQILEIILGIKVL